MRIRRLELLVVVAMGLFVLLLAFSFRPGHRPASSHRQEIPPAPASQAAGEPTTLLDGFDFTESVGGKPLLRIKADRTIGYGPGAGLAPNLYAGEKVTLTVYPEDGAPVTVHADRADYDERSRESKLLGNVRWTDGEGSLAETAEVLFHPANRTLDAPKTVHFTKGSIDLMAPSARYDLRERVVQLSGPLVGSGSGEESGGLSHLTAREGLYRREQGVLELEFVEGQSRTGDRLAADHLIVKMGPTGGGAEWVRATGSVRGTLSPREDSGTPAVEKIVRHYAGDQSMLSFDSDGKARAFSLLGAPAVLWEVKRRLAARQIDVAFSDGRATSARFAGEVRIEAEGNRASAERGSLGFAKDGAADNVALDGNVKIDADGRRGEAARAVQVGEQETWVLLGEAGRSARAESAGSRLSADRIEIEKTRRQVRGQGKARAVFAPDPGKPERTMTLVGNPKRPTYAKADRIVLDDANHLATLSGGATVWQDNSSLFADDMTLADVEKTLTAVNNVRAVLTPAGDQAAKPGDRAASVIAAKHLLYRESDRTARFEGGVTMTRGGLRTTGGESTAWLAKNQDVDCVEMSGQVNLVDRTAGRTGRAEKALDYPKQGKTILWGNPARLTDAGGNQVAGAILTILDRGRSVEVTAPEGGKTETIHRTPND